MARDEAVEGALKEPRAAALASEMQTKPRSSRASRNLSTIAFQSSSNWPIALGVGCTGSGVESATALATADARASRHA